jgi:hypothetical protein
MVAEEVSVIEHTWMGFPSTQCNFPTKRVVDCYHCHVYLPYMSFVLFCERQMKVTKCLDVKYDIIVVLESL